MEEENLLKLGNIMRNEVQRQRNEKMKTSPQLTLGELILKLEAVKDKEVPIVFDFGLQLEQDIKPTGVDSWRGSYNELAIGYDTKGKEKVKTFLECLKEAIGKEFTGYKGGEFLMGKITPVWVANYGESSIVNYNGREHKTIGVTGINIVNGIVIITTEAMEY